MGYTAWLNSDNRAIAAQIRPEGGLVNLLTYSTTDITDTNYHDVMPAPGAGFKNYVTSGLITNSSATGTWVKITDDGTNILCTGYAAPNGGGFLVPGIFTSVEANQKIQVIAETAANIRCTLIGYKDLS